ncbi:MAG TPA: hypothetical protein VJ783_27815 [Pirellulales bacterium]|nr:hypothetical protein [Pirellulales bacterium]
MKASRQACSLLADGDYALHLFERLRMVYFRLANQKWFHERQVTPKDVGGAVAVVPRQLTGRDDRRCVARIAHVAHHVKDNFFSRW